MNKLVKSSLIGLGAIVISTVAIQASDVFRGVEGNLVGMVPNSETGPCGAYAQQVLFGSHAICVDTYEASPSAKCPHANTGSSVQTQENMNEAECQAVSKPDAMPWRFISFTQAQQVCARTNKRLPTNQEWYLSASGMNDASCVIDNPESPLPTGSASCVTPSGIHDMVGNVWEWVDAEINSGLYENRQIPESGYVASVDTAGVVVETGPSGHADYGNDYAWTNTTGLQGMIRGGFYNSGDDGGIFSQNLSVALDFKTAGVGFRCVKDI